MTPLIYAGQGSLKTRTVANMSCYVQRDERLPLLLQRMKASGAFLFLLTNSEYWYTKEVMTYLLKGSWVNVSLACVSFHETKYDNGNVTNWDSLW